MLLVIINKQKHVLYHDWKEMTSWCLILPPYLMLQIMNIYESHKNLYHIELKWIPQAQTKAFKTIMAGQPYGCSWICIGKNKFWWIIYRTLTGINYCQLILITSKWQNSFKIICSICQNKLCFKRNLNKLFCFWTYNSPVKSCLWSQSCTQRKLHCC